MDLERICRLALKQKASDIHLKAGRPPMLRVNGQVLPVKGAALSADELARLAWDMMTPQQRERFKATMDLDMGIEVGDVGRFRVNVFRQRQQVGMVIRVIPPRVLTIDQMGLPGVLKKIAAMPRGLVLVTGATGSGKSTTLAAMVQHINETYRHHVVTIEDPIEYIYEDDKSVVNQREVGGDSASFAAAIRAALRQDPDAVLVGELRDLETVEIAVHAAEAGRLVFGTLHTINAADTVTRLVNFFPVGHQRHVRLVLSTCLGAVVSQRLLPATDGGRVAAVEVMLNTGAVKECILEAERTREIPEHLEKASSQYGTQTFDQHIQALLQQGLITQDVAVGFASNADDMRLRIGGISGGGWSA